MTKPDQNSALFVYLRCASDDFHSNDELQEEKRIAKAAKALNYSTPPRIMRVSRNVTYSYAKRNALEMMAAAYGIRLQRKAAHIDFAIDGLGPFAKWVGEDAILLMSSLGRIVDLSEVMSEASRQPPERYLDDGMEEDYVAAKGLVTGELPERP